MLVTRDSFRIDVEELVDGIWGGICENAFTAGSRVDQASYMKPSDVLYVDIVDCLSVSHSSNYTKYEEQEPPTTLHVFDRIGIAVQDLKRDLRSRWKALVSRVQRASVDSTRQHRVDREVRLVVLYPLPESLFGRDLGSKVGDHEFMRWRKSVGDIFGQGQRLLVILIRRYCICSTVCLQRANRS